MAHPYPLPCPRCGAVLELDLAAAATDWDDYDGCIGSMQEYRFKDAALPCPSCGAVLTVNGVVYDDVGRRTGRLDAR